MTLVATIEVLVVTLEALAIATSDLARVVVAQAVLMVLVNYGEKPEIFNGTYFKRW